MKSSFHGSSAMIDSIRAGGVFGGLFGTSSRSAALSHGEVLHVIESPNPLTDYVLNHEVVGAWETALEVARGDEQVAEAIMSKECASDDAEQGWEFQRLRGILAARLGYTSCEMVDEHGTTWLCLPGCTVRAASSDEII